MGKSIHDDVHDAALDKVATGVTLAVCSQEPTTHTEATSTYKLASTTISSGDFSKAAGDTSGRKVTIAEQEDITVDDSGDADHVAISDGTDLLLVTTATSQTLTSGNTVTVPSFDYEIRDPS